MRRATWPVRERKETDIEADIIRYLTLMGYWTQQTHSGKRLPVRAGALDISFGKGPVWGGIETKDEDGVVSDKQLAEMKRIHAAGGIAILARSVFDVEDALKYGGKP